jgi:hypothetical protein
MTRNPGEAILPTALAELDFTNLPVALAEIPWSHNILLMEKVKDVSRRFWYAQKTVEHGWSLPLLTLQIESDLTGFYHHLHAIFLSKIFLSSLFATGVQRLEPP